MRRLIGLSVVVSVALASCNRGESRLVPFNKSLEAANRATRVINKGPGYALMSDADVNEMLSHYREALSYAEKVDTAFLNSKYSGWGAHLILSSE